MIIAASSLSSPARRSPSQATTSTPEAPTDKVESNPIQQEATDHFVALCKLMKGNKGLTYLSTPVTGGRVNFDFLTAVGKHSKAELTPLERAAYDKIVVGDNTGLSAGIAACLEKLDPDSRVLDPGKYSFPGFTQRDYLNHWLQVIDKVADKLVLAPGWEGSKGCAYEVREALKKGIPVSEIKLDDLKLPQVQARLHDSDEALRQKGFPAEATQEDILKADGFLSSYYLEHR